MIFGNDRDELRRMYRDAFMKSRDGAPMSPLEAQIAAVIDKHPEYHGALGDDELAADYTPESGSTNPFLHMGLHLALRDQVRTDRPAGIAGLYARITAKHQDGHAAEHAMIECLAETLWEAQTNAAPPDEEKYLERLRRLA